MQMKLIKRAASYPQVARIFVHPAIKKALCEMADQVGKDTAWLGKVRPWWNHHYHFHVRLSCPPGIDGCENQKEVSGDNGCGQELTNWYAMITKAAIEAAKAPCPRRQAVDGKAAADHGSAAEGMRNSAHRGRLRAADPDGSRHDGPEPAALKALATKDAGPPIPVLTPAQLAALTGQGGGMPLPDRNPKR